MRTVPNFTKLSPQDLIVFLADKSKDQSELDKAFTEFHKRYAGYMYKVGTNAAALKGVLNLKECEIVVHNALLRAYFRAHTFKPSGEEVSEISKEKIVKAWLAAIMKNETKKYIKEEIELNKKTIVTDTIDDYIDYVQAIPDEPDEPSPPNQYKEKLEGAMKGISERNLEITFTYLEYEDENGKLTPEMYTRLQQKYTLLPGYLSKIKKRTIEKLMQLNPHHTKSNTNETNKEERGSRAHRGLKRLSPRNGTDVPGDTGTG